MRRDDNGYKTSNSFNLLATIADTVVFSFSKRRPRPVWGLSGSERFAGAVNTPPICSRLGEIGDADGRGLQFKKDINKTSETIAETADSGNE